MRFIHFARISVGVLAIAAAIAVVASLRSSGPTIEINQFTAPRAWADTVLKTGDIEASGNIVASGFGTFSEVNLGAGPSWSATATVPTGSCGPGDLASYTTGSGDVYFCDSQGMWSPIGGSGITNSAGSGVVPTTLGDGAGDLGSSDISSVNGGPSTVGHTLTVDTAGVAADGLFVGTGGPGVLNGGTSPAANVASGSIALSTSGATALLWSTSGGAQWFGYPHWQLTGSPTSGFVPVVVGTWQIGNSTFQDNGTNDIAGRSFYSTGTIRVNGSTGPIWNSGAAAPTGACSPFGSFYSMTGTGGQLWQCVNGTWEAVGSGTVSGTGTIGRYALWTGTSTLGSGSLTDDGAGDVASQGSTFAVETSAGSGICVVAAPGTLGPNARISCGSLGGGVSEIDAIFSGTLEAVGQTGSDYIHLSSAGSDIPIIVGHATTPTLTIDGLALAIGSDSTSVIIGDAAGSTGLFGDLILIGGAATVAEAAPTMTFTGQQLHLNGILGTGSGSYGYVTLTNATCASAHCTNTGGTITLTAAAPTVTFDPSAYAQTPTCLITPLAAGKTPAITAISSLAFTLGGLAAADSVGYFCFLPL